MRMCLLITHILTSLVYLPLVSIELYPFALIGSILPDLIDYYLKLKHRNPITHNLLTPIIPLALSPPQPIALLFIAYLHHLTLDLLTKQGVYIGAEKVRLTKIESKNPLYNLLTLLLHLLIFLFLTTKA